jgi:hypothetical protein
MAFVRRPGADSRPRSRSESIGAMIAGHTATSATISPSSGRVPFQLDRGVCSRRPEMRADASRRRSIVGFHEAPVVVSMPRAFRSRQMLDSDSPANTRAAHSRITAASASTTVTRSSS